MKGKERFWMAVAVVIVMPGVGCKDRGREEMKSLDVVEGWGSVAEVYSKGCAECHGMAGAGNDPKQVPAIAGLPDYYVAGELGKFRNLLRGIEPNALDGSLEMHGIATSMTVELMKGLGAHVAGMRPATSELTVAEGADLARGRQLYDGVCAECHGRDAEGDPARESPPLFVFQDWYLAVQIEKFQAGLRDSSPANEASLRMHATAVQLMREGDVRDVVGFIKSRLTGQSDADP